MRYRAQCSAENSGSGFPLHQVSGRFVIAIAVHSKLPLACVSAQDIIYHHSFITVRYRPDLDCCFVPFQPFVYCAEHPAADSPRGTVIKKQIHNRKAANIFGTCKMRERGRTMACRWDTSQQTSRTYSLVTDSKDFMSTST